ncbi:hydroxyacylglutathione hydrolase [Marinobacter sp. SBS5]|uniref:hydroxyacylglutathione hydrolase n=1 Tax=Marinobacter sp. SBS5 TaxID=3401754 RepID=UPI003AAA87FE
MFSIYPIPAFSDNYIWCLADTEAGKALVVDPGQAQPVTDYLEQAGLTLDTILVTHHHPDHTGGIAKLIEGDPTVRIVGPEGSPFTNVTETVCHGDNIEWQTISFHILATPGHTLDHIVYFTETEVNGAPVLFCGDTLFIGGCGRLFEGTPAQMHGSLNSLRALPDSTAIYCAHEYTLANLRFARHWLPEDAGLIQFEQKCFELRQAGKPTVPSSLKNEKALNLFLRWDDPAVVRAAEAYGAEKGLPVTKPAEVFAAIRHGKDHF